MSEADRWSYILKLDDTLLKGGVTLSEWASFIIRESDNAFAKGTFLSCILTAMCAIETHLRSESQARKERLVDLINNSRLNEELRSDLHRLRRYRNQWVHVDEPWNDELLLEQPERIERELEDMAHCAVSALRRTIYAHQWL